LNFRDVLRRRQKVKTWTHRVRQNLDEIRAELTNELPLLVMLHADTLKELAAMERQLNLIGQRQVGGDVNRAACRAQSPEEP
jgi:hypothetical protein